MPNVPNNSTATYAQTAVTNAPPTTEWNITFGLGHYNTAHQIVQTPDNGYAAIGMYGSQHPLQTTLVKLDPNGSVRWYQKYDLQFVNYPMNTALQVTNDSGYAIVGNQYKTLTLTLIKTDLNGTIQWSQTYSNDVLAWGMTQTRDCGYLIVGVTTFRHSEFSPKSVFIKTDAAGVLQWKKTMNTTGRYTVVQANDGNYIAAGGNRIAKVDTSGNILWAKELPPVLPSNSQQYRYSYNYIVALTKTDDGGYLLAGHTENERNNTHERVSGGVIIKTDSEGTTQWNHTYGTDRQAWFFSAVKTSDKGYALGGMWHTLPDSTVNDFSQTDMILVKTDAAGNVQWNQTFGNSQSADHAFSLINTNDGGFALAGMAKPGTIYSEGYYYIVKTTSVSQPTPTPSSVQGDTTWGFTLSLELLAVITVILITIISLTLIVKRRKKPSNRGS